MKVQIEGRWIGPGEPCFIIAEAGSNHNGSLEQALTMIELAKAAGADAVKFQNFRAEHLYPVDAGMSDYLPIKKPIFDIIKSMEMPFDWVPKLAARCRDRGIIFFSAPTDEVVTDLLEPHVGVFKITSYEMTHEPFIRYVAAKRKPMILSTGTADLEEVAETVKWCRSEGNHDIILMQCTAAYPAPLESLNVKALDTLRTRFGVPAGLSDHSRDPIVGPMTAAALGANILEKHFTLSNRLPGPDHAYALEPAELTQMVAAVRQVEKAVGSGEKVRHPVEDELHAFARRSIFTSKRIEKGEALTEKNITVLRRGKRGIGLSPSQYFDVLGKVALRDLQAGTLLQLDDLR